MKFQLTGWKAIAFLICAAIFIVGKNVWHQSDPQGAINAIKPWLKGEYSRYYLDLMGSNAMSMEEGGAKIVEAGENLELKVTAMTGSSRQVVCVKISVAGEKPPIGKDERCFRLKHSALMGWIYDRETDNVGYYLELLRPW